MRVDLSSADNNLVRRERSLSILEVYTISDDIPLIRYETVMYLP